MMVANPIVILLLVCSPFVLVDCSLPNSSNISISGVDADAEAVFGGEKLLSSFNSSGNCLAEGDVHADARHGAGDEVNGSSVHDPASQEFTSFEEKLSFNVSVKPSNDHAAVPGAILLCCGFMIPFFHAKKKEIPRKSGTSSKQLTLVDSVSSMEVSPVSVPATPSRVPQSPSRFGVSPQLSRIGSVHLSIQEILRATRNFSPSFKLGEGGFGTVYKAVMPDGQTVAVKRAKKDQFPSQVDEFNNEVDILAKIDHGSLVRFLGYTDKGDERIIITEYVPNGTLREHLDGMHGRILDFNQRLSIAIDVAHGLAFLHMYAGRTIIHRDVKSSNILLTDNYRAKLSDFGFARGDSSAGDKTHISTKVKGTAGYLDPEYLKTYQLTPKSDVFSFGILLIEILSARRPVEQNRPQDERITIRWAFKNFTQGKLLVILDPMLSDPVSSEVLEKLFALAFQCAAPTREDRPDMKTVGEQLWDIRREYSNSLRRA